MGGINYVKKGFFKRQDLVDIRDAAGGILTMVKVSEKMGVKGVTSLAPKAMGVSDRLNALANRIEEEFSIGDEWLAGPVGDKARRQAAEAAKP